MEEVLEKMDAKMDDFKNNLQLLKKQVSMKDLKILKLEEKLKVGEEKIKILEEILLMSWEKNLKA